MATRKGFEYRAEALNQPNIQLRPDEAPKVGWREVCASIGQMAVKAAERNRHAIAVIGIDGYVETDWLTFTKGLERTFEECDIALTLLDVQSCLKSEPAIDELLQPYLGDDPVFGRLYKGDLKSLFDLEKVAALKYQIRRLKKNKGVGQRRVVVCYGSGALIAPLRSGYDLTVYADLTREEALRRNKSWSGLAGKTQSISPKRLYYVDFQVNDRHRNRLLKRLDLYLDGNGEPVLFSGATLQHITGTLADWPFKLKYMYEPGPWGGQWLRKIRQLPQEWVNCAWSYEIIAPEMSLLVDIDGVVVELPWTTFFHLQYDQVMGKVPKSRFGGEFPIRFDYLDTMGGGDLSIQVHPTTRYIHEHFGEPYHQAEMYYIVDAKEGASANLGLNEETDAKAFLAAAELADRDGIKFNYRDYVHRVPCKKHDLLLIPPGTVHGSGEGLVVLEISATTYRYTFKIYDHLRPDLNGVMRPIHLGHAFNVIKWFRRSRWVDKNLKQDPRVVRSGDGWVEYLIGDRREFFHIVFRLEFDRQVEDDTQSNFHILTLVEGEAVELRSLQDQTRKLAFKYSETVVVPAGFGKYQIVNLGAGRCRVVKARLR